MSGRRVVRLREPFTWFVDRSLGKKVLPGALCDIGERVEIHDEKFSARTKDQIWLHDAGPKRWVVLTKDDEIRRNAVEFTALHTASVGAFVLVGGNLKGPDIVSCFLAALPAMKRFLNERDTPFVATIAKSAVVTLVLDAGGLETKIRKARARGERTGR